MKHFSHILKIAFLAGAGALAGCHGGPHTLSMDDSSGGGRGQGPVLDYIGDNNVGGAFDTAIGSVRFGEGGGGGTAQSSHAGRNFGIAYYDSFWRTGNTIVSAAIENQNQETRINEDSLDVQRSLPLGLTGLYGANVMTVLNPGDNRGALFMDVYTNIEAPIPVPANLMMISLEANDFAVIPSPNIRQGRGRIAGDNEGERIPGTWRWRCEGNCNLTFMAAEGGELTRIASVEGTLEFVRDDNGAVEELRDSFEFVIDNEEINLIRDGRAYRGDVRCGIDGLCFSGSPLSGREFTITPTADATLSVKVDTAPDADYLVSGGWVLLPEGGNEFEVGVFADGAARLTDLPTSGTAVYTGAATGLAYQENGENSNLFKFQAVAALNANWAANQVGGALTNFQLSAENAGIAAGNAGMNAAFRTIIPENFQLNLNPAPIDTDVNAGSYGQFNGATGGWTGAWGGRFYGDEASSAAGTFGAKNGDNYILGAFGAEKQ